MDLRTDLEFTERGVGLTTLGENKIIELEDGRKIELLPILFETHYTRGTSPDDVRRKRHIYLAIPILAKAYAQYFNSADIDENWSVTDAEKMMWSLTGEGLFFVKWAREVGSNEIFPIGFVGAHIKPFAGGNRISDGEIFVLPEYQTYGIGSELHKALLIKGKLLGLNIFEAITFEDGNGFPLKLWEKYGLNPTQLVHVIGNIDEMIKKLDDSQKTKMKAK